MDTLPNEILFPILEKCECTCRLVSKSFNQGWLSSRRIDEDWIIKHLNDLKRRSDALRKNIRDIKRDGRKCYRNIDEVSEAEKESRKYSILSVIPHTRKRWAFLFTPNGMWNEMWNNGMWNSWRGGRWSIMDLDIPHYFISMHNIWDPKQFDEMLKKFNEFRKTHKKKDKESKVFCKKEYLREIKND